MNPSAPRGSCARPADRETLRPNVDQPPKLPARRLLVLFAFALAVRVLYQLEMAGNPLLSIPFGGAAFYHAWGVDVAHGQASSEVLYHAPLYPQFLGAVFRVFGDDVGVVRAIQAVLGALACVFVATFAAAFFSRRVGLWAGVLLAVFPQALLFESVLKKTSLGLFLTALVFALVARTKRRPTVVNALATGLALGLAGALRENVLVLVPVFAAYLWWSGAGAKKRVLAFALASVVPLAAMGVRNELVAGEFVFGTTNLGANLYIGNHAGASGFFEPLEVGHGSATYDGAVARRIAELERGRALSARDVSRYWSDRALSDIRAAPLAWLTLLAKKAFYLLHATEWVDDHDLGTFQRESRVLRVLGIPVRYGVVVPFALVGIALSWPRRRELRVAMLSLLALAAGIVLFFVTSRFRLSLMPLLLPFAAVTCTTLVDRIRARAYGSTLRIACGVGLLGVFVHWPTGIEEFPVSSTYNFVGLALQDQERNEEALEWFERASEANPGNASAHYSAGMALLALDRYDEARARLETAARIAPAFGADGASALGNHFAERLDFENALPLFEFARDLAPDRARHHYNVGLAQRILGDADASEAAYREAIRVDPRYAEAHNNLGMLLEVQGRLDEAAREFEAAIAIDGYFVVARANLERVRASAAGEN